MFCSGCGKEIKDEAVFCTHCGAPASGKSEEQKESGEQEKSGMFGRFSKKMTDGIDKFFYEDIEKIKLERINLSKYLKTKYKDIKDVDPADVDEFDLDGPTESTEKLPTPDGVVLSFFEERDHTGDFTDCDRSIIYGDMDKKGIKISIGERQGWTGANTKHIYNLQTELRQGSYGFESHEIESTSIMKSALKYGLAGIAGHHATSEKGSGAVAAISGMLAFDMDTLSTDVKVRVTFQFTDGKIFSASTDQEDWYKMHEELFICDFSRQQPLLLSQIKEWESMIVALRDSFSSMEESERQEATTLLNQVKRTIAQSKKFYKTCGTEARKRGLI